MCHSLKSSCNYIKKVCLYCSINNTINLQCIQSAMGSYEKHVDDLHLKRYETERILAVEMSISSKLN